MAQNKITPCILPWSHLSTDPLGTIRPCCIAKDCIKTENYTYNIKEDSLTDVQQSAYMRAFRDEFRSGKFPKSCEICKTNEENNIVSKRLQHLEWQKKRNVEILDFNQEPKFITDLQLILSNKCNLKCRSCNAIYSSKWIQESKERDLVRFNKFIPDLDFQLGHKLFQTMDQWSHTVKHIEYMGGEPLIQSEFTKLTEKLIEINQAKHINLSFSTNATVNGEAILGLLCENFKHVSLNLSIDGIGERFEYLRHGAKWKDVEQNIISYSLLQNKKYSNFSLGITHTVTWLNVYYVPEIYNLIRQIDPKLNITLNLVFNPDYLNAAILPIGVNQQVLQHLKKYVMRHPEVKVSLQTLTQHLESAYPHRLLFEEGILINKDADRYRNENFSAVFPEFYQIIEKYYTRAKKRRWSVKYINNFINRFGLFDFIYDTF